jgi:hypothetical protein
LYLLDLHSYWILPCAVGYSIRTSMS